MEESIWYNSIGMDEYLDISMAIHKDILSLGICRPLRMMMMMLEQMIFGMQRNSSLLQKLSTTMPLSGVLYL